MDIGFIFAIIWALVYAISIDVEALTLIPQEKWFAFTSGVSIAYVVLDILPRLASIQSPSEGDVSTSSTNVALYCVILAGILIFSGLEQLAWRSQRLESKTSDLATPASTSSLVFALHIAVIALYVSSLSVLQTRYSFESEIIERSLLFTVIVLHFIVIDHRLTELHQAAYRRIGRWVIIGVLLISTVAPESLLPFPEIFDYMWAFAAGALLVCSLQRELLPQRKSCFWSFGFGAVIFSTVLVLL